jgi:hypothetical protein
MLRGGAGRIVEVLMDIQDKAMNKSCQSHL